MARRPRLTVVLVALIATSCTSSSTTSPAPAPRPRAAAPAAARFTVTIQTNGAIHPVLLRWSGAYDRAAGRAAIAAPRDGLMNVSAPMAAVVTPDAVYVEFPQLAGR